MNVDQYLPASLEEIKLLANLVNMDAPSFFINIPQVHIIRYTKQALKVSIISKVKRNLWQRESISGLINI